jgi:ketosteroid isomerase-like protein
LVCASGLLVGACGAPQEEPAATTASQPEGSTDVSSTSEILQRHLDTFGAHDLDGIVADYAPDAVIFTPNGVVRGTTEIRQMFQTMFAEWSKPGVTFEMRQQVVDGPYAYLFWTAETADSTYEGAMDGFVIQNGKIVTQFFAGHITPKAAQ